jgi:hypothetical protein
MNPARCHQAADHGTGVTNRRQTSRVRAFRTCPKQKTTHADQQGRERTIGERCNNKKKRRHAGRKRQAV